ncbi:MAG TPA: DUF4142 domain-containing protein [Nevskia sp.]|nr:DUF4142 domain-containing protein [Nevskia sp.]
MKGFLAAFALLLLFGLAGTLEDVDAQAVTRPAPAAPAAPVAAPRDRTQTQGQQGDALAQPGYAGGDASFFKEGAGAGLAEVAAGQLAAQQAADPRVRQFAQQMVKDHSRANQELQALARQKGVTLPTAPDAKHQQVLQELKTKRGTAFDKAYVQAQLSDHKDAVSLFDVASGSTDPDVSAFASKTLPVLRHHLQMAESLQHG